MEDDDDFGDLYTDVLPISSATSSFPANQKLSSLAGVNGGSDSDNDDGKTIHASTLPPDIIPKSSSLDRERKVSSDDDDDDWLLGRDPPPVEEPDNWVEDDDPPVVEMVSNDVAGVLSFKDSGGAARVSEKDDVESSKTLDGGESSEKTLKLNDLDGDPVIPCLDVSAVSNNRIANTSESYDWDSGSEDDLQIVLNDPAHDLQGMDGRDGGGSDEDDEDLVIVTDDDRRHHLQTMEEHDWGDDAMQSSLDGEKKELLEAAKATGAAMIAAGTSAGYSNHGFNSQHHSMFKYVRPGATPAPRGPSMVAGSTLGQIRPPAFGAQTGRGRGDWRPVGGGGFANMPKGFHSGYGMPWGNTAAGRPYVSGLDFSLPSHKTVFDIDIEGFEEKPWRHPGVDISDFFNFGLDEDHWKEYCNQLEQLRLESTMQGKIRVYESGRSEQDYDPDLPPELAAATGHINMPADNPHFNKAENGPADIDDQGRGNSVRPALPTGRAIQVESGFGERLPSVDTRPPRFRDLDAVIEIVLQDDPNDVINSNSAFEPPDNTFERENQKVFRDVEEEDDRAVESEFYGHFSHNSSSQLRESVVRRIPTLDNGDDFEPLPSEVSRRKSWSPVGSARSFETTPHGGRSIHCLRESLPHGNACSDEKASDKMEGDKPFDSPHSGVAREPSMEPKDVERGDVLDYGHEGDEIEAFDFRVSNETVADDCSNPFPGKQKLHSCVNQSGGGDNGADNESRFTPSDNSPARSENIGNFDKTREANKEVLQALPLKHAGDSSRKHYREEDDRRQRTDYARTDARNNRPLGRETTHELYMQKDWDAGSRHVFRDSGGAWHKREDEGHYIKQSKVEDVRRSHNEEIRPPPRERSKARMVERKEKIDPEKDWRGRGKDDGLRHRERNDVSMSRRDSVEDGQMKRKRDVEVARRERVDKDDSYRSIEDSRRKKRARDDVFDHRKEEERHVGKHRDRPSINPAHDDDRRLASRSGRPAEEKKLAVTVRSKDGLKLDISEKEYRDNDRRRHSEVPKKSIRNGEENEPLSKPRDLREKRFSSEQRGGRHERLSTHHDHQPSITSDDQKERRRESIRKAENYEAVGHKGVSGKRKRGDHHDDRRSERTTTENKKLHGNAGPMDLTSLSAARHKDDDPTSDGESHDSRRGRSKLERWTSHKERDYAIADAAVHPSSVIHEIEESQFVVNDSFRADSNKSDIVETNADDSLQAGDRPADERDRHLDTVAKLKMRSERFKLPMPGEKDRDQLATKKPIAAESEAPPCIQNEPTSSATAAAVCDADIKLERPARKRKWTSS